MHRQDHHSTAHSRWGVWAHRSHTIPGSQPPGQPWGTPGILGLEAACEQALRHSFFVSLTAQQCCQVTRLPFQYPSLLTITLCSPSTCRGRADIFSLCRAALLGHMETASHPRPPERSREPSSTEHGAAGLGTQTQDGSHRWVWEAVSDWDVTWGCPPLLTSGEKHYRVWPCWWHGTCLKGGSPTPHKPQSPRSSPTAAARSWRLFLLCPSCVDHACWCAQASEFECSAASQPGRTQQTGGYWYPNVQHPGSLVPTPSHSKATSL